MNAFDNAKLTEARGLAVLVPFLKERAFDGRFVLTNKGRMARYLQETVGDALFNCDADTVWTIEIKVEESDIYGNFFLETWSNKNLNDKKNQADHGSNPGWMLKVRADLLFYYFLESDELYIIDLFKLRRWAFVHENGEPNIDRFREKLQGKRVQANDTWGRCVPISVIKEAVGFRKIFPLQIELFGSAA